MKIGDKYKIDYLYDCSKANGKIGTIIWLNTYNYYPNGDKSIIEKRTQGTVKLEDNNYIEISNMKEKNVIKKEK